jgi:uncharacterized ferritin-like protein (DUF455 family)
MSKLGQGRKLKLAAAAKIDQEKSAWVMPNFSSRHKSIQNSTPIPDRSSSPKSTNPKTLTKKLLPRKDIYSKTMHSLQNQPKASNASNPSRPGSVTGSKKV